jgi:3-oxoacyl-[acyl-carrier protein] reductase
LLYRCDVSDDAGVRAMMQAIADQFGRLDVLINNAGTTVDVEPANLEAMGVEEWKRVFDVNVLGLFLVTRAAVPLLKRSPNGCIVNTCSIAALRPSALRRSSRQIRRRPWMRPRVRPTTTALRSGLRR